MFTNKDNSQKWGSAGNQKKSWLFSDENELVGLYGQNKDDIIESLGVIVFKAVKCAGGLPIDDTPAETNGEEERADSEGKDESEEATEESEQFSFFDDFGNNFDGLNRDIDGPDSNPLLVGLLMVIGVVVVAAVLCPIVYCCAPSCKSKPKKKDASKDGDDTQEEAHGHGIVR